MFLRFETIQETQLAGLCTRMSFRDDHTPELWQRFMPLYGKQAHSSGSDLFSLEIYPPGAFTAFSPGTEFEKWAAAEVLPGSSPAAGLLPLVIPAGLYAVFLHKGPASAAPATYTYIFTEWLPASGYTTDERPHFARMGAAYKNEDPGSEEEIWIPVRPADRDTGAFSDM